MILAINTAQHLHEMALLTKDKILLEKKWEDNRDDLTRLPETLKEMLASLEIPKEEIKQIVVVRGPGSFTSLRTGVAFANALAEGLNAELYSLDTFELLRKRVATKDPVITVLDAGGLDIGVSFNDKIEVGQMHDLLAQIPHGQNICLAYELKETLHDELKSISTEKGWRLIEGEKLLSFAEALLTSGTVDTLTKTDTVEPFYLKTPNITLSSNPWKKP